MFRTVLLFLAIGIAGVNAEEIKVFSGGAPQIVLREVTPAFESATGHRASYTFALVTVIEQRLKAGETADLILLPMPLLAALEKTAVPFQVEGRGALARVGIGIIVREGANRPDITSADAIKNLLLQAKAIAIPEPSTPSGAHMAKVIDQLGVSETVKPKLIVRAAINGGGDLVAAGGADVGFYLLSEVQSIKGIAVAGLMPSPIQSFVTYGAGIPSANKSPAPALALVKYLHDPARREQWDAAGFDLLK